MDYSLEIPKLSSLVLAHDLNAPLAGLETIRAATGRRWRSYSGSFCRVMVTLGLACGVRPLQPAGARARQTVRVALADRLAVLMDRRDSSRSSAGWVTTEVGRSRLPSTTRCARESVSPIASPAVTGSLIAFVLVYFSAFISGAIYILKLNG